MPRKKRAISTTGIYHITLRSINQHIIFEEDADYFKCLSLLSDCKTDFDVDIYAYCLMDNHIHLLLYSAPENLSPFFQSFGTRFVRWYNNKYSRSGHLFQDRFFSVPVETKKQYLATLVYIHNNPVKAVECRVPSEYRWSSYNAFYGSKDSLVNLSASYKIAGSKEQLLSFFTSDSKLLEEKYFSDIHSRAKHYITDEKALSVFKSVTRLTSTSDVINLPKHIRNQYIRSLHQRGLTQKQLSRLMDVSVSTVKRACLEEQKCKPE